jgi:hypothetical protein
MAASAAAGALAVIVFGVVLGCFFFSAEIIFAG